MAIASAPWLRTMILLLVIVGVAGSLVLWRVVGKRTIQPEQKVATAEKPSPTPGKPKAATSLPPKNAAVTELRKRKAADAAAKRQLAAQARLQASADEPKVIPRRRMITPVEALKLAPGFRLELVRVAELEEGSWICMTTDPQGRLIISGQPGQGIFRATLVQGEITKWEKLQLSLSGAMGMVYAHDSLYLTALDEDGYGLFRCRDTNGDEQFDQIEKLTHFGGSGDEHGPHAVRLGPDGKVYCIIGDRTPLIAGISPSSPHRNHQEDIITSTAKNAGNSRGKEHYPGGYVVRTDADGKDWEIVLGGLRNCYDFAFNGDGELITVDSDMDIDWGLPWYRPSRIVHATSGAEFGCRPNSGKWPTYFEDSLPPVHEIGLSSPTGVESGAGAKFPAKYQRAMYFLDWTYGRVLAAHLQPAGSSYSATIEPLVTPAKFQGDDIKQPFNVTDLVIGNDGAMYFVVGGRNARGALYRVTYEGQESTKPVTLANQDGAKARALRQKLEAFHGRQDPQAVAELWPHLGSNDRHLRSAARIALESQPVETWQAKALAEKEPASAINSLLALTRVGPPDIQPQVQEALLAIPLSELAREQQLMLLRTWSVNLMRHRESVLPTIQQSLVQQLDELVPTQDEILNREGMRLLVQLDAPSAVGKGLALIAQAKTQQDLLFHLMQLRFLSARHWTLEQRRNYLEMYGKNRPALPSEPQLVSWFEEVGRKYTDGSAFYEFLTNYFWETVDHLSLKERKELDETIELVNTTIVPQFDSPTGMQVVKNWTLDELLQFSDQVDVNRNFERGRRAFARAQCIQCHRFDGTGGISGPDLTTVARRFSREQIIESIVAPSRVVPDQYEHILIATVDGEVINGRLIEETSEHLVLRPNPLRPDRITILKDDIEQRSKSKFSAMPEHLVDVLHREELLDLIAYLESAGNTKYVAFQKVE